MSAARFLLNFDAFRAGATCGREGSERLGVLAADVVGSGFEATGEGRSMVRVKGSPFSRLASISIFVRRTMLACHIQKKASVSSSISTRRRVERTNLDG